MDAPVVQWTVKHITEPLRPFATKPEPEVDPLVEDEALLAELALLYNHKDDDSPQFTRWQMLVAMHHGRAARHADQGDNA